MGKLREFCCWNILLTETIMPVSRAMMVNPWAAILPLIILCKKLLVSATFLNIWWVTWLPSLSFLPNLKRPLTRKKVVAPQPEKNIFCSYSFFGGKSSTYGEEGVLLELPDQLLRGRLPWVLLTSVSVHCQLFVQLGNFRWGGYTKRGTIYFYVPVSTQIHPLQVYHLFLVAFSPEAFCTPLLFHLPLWVVCNSEWI